MHSIVGTLQIKHRINAFTIVELLVVIGIIAILAVTLLALLNPAEAQRRTRDAKRLRDLNTIQAIVNQYLEDGHRTVQVAPEERLVLPLVLAMSTLLYVLALGTGSVERQLDLHFVPTPKHFRLIQ